MGDSERRTTAAEVELWLRKGGCVVAASERAARAVAEEFSRGRKAEGLTAWSAPRISAWSAFIRETWEALRVNDERLVMNEAQEEAVWAKIVAASRYGVALLEPPLQRIAKMAANAHALLCAYAPHLLSEKARASWQQDAAAFSTWLAEFNRECQLGHLVSAAKLQVELPSLLEAVQSKRAPVLLVGFDRLQPGQKIVLDAWGQWQEAQRGEPATEQLAYAVEDEQAELNACLVWCREKLAASPDGRLLIVTQELLSRRGALERAFSCLGPEINARVEYSLGMPLGQISLVRAALLLLRWLSGQIDEKELDWLLGSGVAVTGMDETHGLTGFMLEVRRKGMERTRWSCEQFLRQRSGFALPDAWSDRTTRAMALVKGVNRSTRAPWEWAEFVPEILRTAGWPGGRVLTSHEFQAVQRWEYALEMSASLGFDGRRVVWAEYLRLLERRVEETLFAPESHDAEIVVAGPAESAGLEADAIWMLGATEDAWPAKGALHPLLPPGVQRDAKMPHGTANDDWELAQAMTNRLMTSASEICFSYARQVEGVEKRASRLVRMAVGDVKPVPAALMAQPSERVEADAFQDGERVVYLRDAIHGGAAVLNAQSQCPFKAFAKARLGAEGWEPAEAGLNAKQRGNLLHAVLHSVWSVMGGVRSSAELRAVPDLRAFASDHVRAVLARSMPENVKDRMPRGYLALEELRLTTLVTEWLNYECTREKFWVVETESEKNVTIGGLKLKLRVDRIDRLNDDKLLVIDYKTGDPKTTAWEMPRPEDVQLPLYADFALGDSSLVGGLVFAKVRAGKNEFTGRIRNATTLLPGVSKLKDLSKRPLTPEMLGDWQRYFESMVRDFLYGNADVDPIDLLRTCQDCDLKTLCRVKELESDESAEDSDEEVVDA